MGQPEHGQEAESDEKVTHPAAKQETHRFSTNARFIEDWITALRTDDVGAIAELIDDGLSSKLPFSKEFYLSISCSEDICGRCSPERQQFHRHAPTRCCR